VPTIHLEPIGRFPGLRVLAWEAGVLYAARQYALFRWTAEGGRWQPMGSWNPGAWRRWVSAFRLGDRFVRGGCHALARLGDGGLVAAFPKVLALLPAGARRFQPTFRIPRGRRPLMLAGTPTGWLYWGEYFRNPARDPVHVYGSADGVTWRIVYTFPAGTVNHVHSIAYDRYAQCLWVLTGDEGDACRILRTGLDWSSVDTVLSGDQQARAVALVPRADALYFASDTEWEQNYIYRLDRGGRVTRLAAIAASSFWGCAVGRAVFFTTAVEPSPVNTHPEAMIYGSADGTAWTPLVRWRHDGWHLRLFQYANIILPAGDNDGDILAASGTAVRGEDEVTHVWRVRVED